MLFFRKKILVQVSRGSSRKLVQRFHFPQAIHQRRLPCRVTDCRLLLGQFTRRHRFDDDRLQFRIQSLDQLVDGDSSPLNRHLGPRPTDNLAEFLQSACSGGCLVASRRRRGRGLILGGERGKVAGEKSQADGVFKQVRFRVWRQVTRLGVSCWREAKSGLKKACVTPFKRAVSAGRGGLWSVRFRSKSRVRSNSGASRSSSSW